ncbi:MAG: hypothetical protein AAF806_27035, partial [Bacteroidota bacterium]
MFNKIFFYSLFILVLLLSQSCANYKLNYAKGAENWVENKPTEKQAIRHSMYLIGDTGNTKMDEILPIFQYLKKELAQANKNSSILFLGDNIYPMGMPTKDEDANRALAEHKLDVQLEMLEDFKGEILFIPGD